MTGTGTHPSGVILASFPERNGRPSVMYRNAGDSFLLVEFGEMVFDLTMSFRVLGLDDAIKRHRPAGLIETIPALRSILINYDSRQIGVRDLIDFVEDQYEHLPPFENLVVPSRIVELPIAFDDKWTREAIARYVQYQRADAPNVIDGTNSKYAAMYNGLRDEEEFFNYIMATDWWNAALGFFPGLPFAYPLDPRYAVVLPKYNPTRHWTPAGTVGIAGPCLAIYPVESAGGYQIFGHTVPIYDPQQRNPAFRESPVLLRPGDRLRFRPRVTDEELEAMIQAVYDGTYQYRIDETATFDVGAYLTFLKEVEPEAEAFRRRQAEAAARVPVP